MHASLCTISGTHQNSRPTPRLESYISSFQSSHYTTSFPHMLPSTCSSTRPMNRPVLAHGVHEDTHLALPGAMLAGCFAGILEDFIMFPVDTIKTRMQVVQSPTGPANTTFVSTLSNIVRKEGIFRLYRGLSPMVLAAGPSHALYFGSYEYVKNALHGSREQHTPMISAIAGVCATIGHDAIQTPMDVIKQRMQVYGSQHTRIMETFRAVLNAEGFTTFINSYLATLVLNIPYIATHFVIYEAAHTQLNLYGYDNNAIADLFCGSLAATLSAVVATPLDVIKTRVQTHEWKKDQEHPGVPQFIRSMVQKEGWQVFTKGMSARIIWHAPSAAICWATYEYMRRFFISHNLFQNKDNHHVHRHEH